MNGTIANGRNVNMTGSSSGGRDETEYEGG